MERQYVAFETAAGCLAGGVAAVLVGIAAVVMVARLNAPIWLTLIAILVGAVALGLPVVAVERWAARETVAPENEDQGVEQE